MADKHNSPPDPSESEYRGLKVHAIPSLHEECMAQIQALGLPKDARVLDLGAGEGAFSQRLLDAGLQVNAVELEPGRFRLNVPCQNVNLNLDFHGRWNEPFDLVVAIEILEHLHDPRHFIRNCLQSLTNNGYLLVTSPNTESWLSRIRFLRDGHFLWFDESDYRGYGHLTPIFSWQVRQICQELGATLVNVSSTKNELLRQRLGDNLTGKLKNKAFYLSALYPLMKGQKDGEVNIYLIQKGAA
ncbi:MAG TPA: class I SAM-dependent methyltransferase [Pyrinomonadaceae bacterium]|nr:class I SAM-dependent methyltransferase [Pyrinomonadaceae bacterium]